MKNDNANEKYGVQWFSKVDIFGRSRVLRGGDRLTFYPALPRAPGVFGMGNMFLKKISSTSGPGSALLVLDNVLKIWIELMKCLNDNATGEFY